MAAPQKGYSSQQESAPSLVEPLRAVEATLQEQVVLPVSAEIVIFFFPQSFPCTVAFLFRIPQLGFSCSTLSRDHIFVLFPPSTFFYHWSVPCGLSFLSRVMLIFVNLLKNLKNILVFKNTLVFYDKHMNIYEYTDKCKHIQSIIKKGYQSL